MKQFRFRLATLLRLREATRDERRAQLAEAYLAEQRLNDHRQSVLNEVDGLRKNYSSAAAPGTLNVDQLVGTYRYQLILGAQLKVIDEQAQKLATEIERRRQALVAADREVRVLEKLREQQQEKHRQEAERQDNRQIDETAVISFCEETSQERCC